MKKYLFNLYHNWKNLPWKKIVLRIIMIQEQIYYASKTYNLIYMRKLQKYLINSNEAKIVSTYKVLEEIYEYYLYYSKEKYTTIKYTKCKIFNSQVYTKVAETIKQYLIVLCIKPEWKSKFIKKLPKYYQYNSFKLFVKNISFNSYYIYNYQSTKYIFINDIIYKLKSNKYIYESIKYWLYNNYCINLYKTKFINEKANLNSNFLVDSLLIVLLKVMTLDIEWYFFYIKYFKLINQVNISYQKKQLLKFKCYPTLSKIIKLFLYHKNSCNKLKVNTVVNKSNVFTKINNILKQYYNNNLEFTPTHIINNNNKILNKNIYYW